MTLFPLAIPLLAFMLVSYLSNTENSTRHVTKESQTSNLHHRHSFWIVCDIPCQQWGTGVICLKHFGRKTPPSQNRRPRVPRPYSPMCCHSRGQLWQKPLLPLALPRPAAYPTTGLNDEKLSLSSTLEFKTKCPHTFWAYVNSFCVAITSFWENKSKEKGHVWGHGFRGLAPWFLGPIHWIRTACREECSPHGG